jgi:predicted small secreted protein
LSAAPPSAELIAAIVEMKRRNPRFGYMRIAQQISDAFGVEIDKDIVRRVLAKHYRPGDSGCHGPSWLTFIAQTKDSLWSLDLLRCESILLRSLWVMLKGQETEMIKLFSRAALDPKNKKGVFVMKRLIALMLATSYVILGGLAACNTIQGAGKDVERGGEKIQKEAQENKKY